MGHGAETPRQKMIGLMYLFLTALMALNVSKDVLNSFVQVSDSLEQTIANYSTKNDKVYNEFDKQMLQNPGKVKQWKDKSDIVKLEAQKLYDMLEEHKFGLLDYAEGEETEAIVDGKVKPSLLKAKDNIDKGGEYFIGGTPNNCKGKEIRDALHRYMESLLNVVPEDEVSLRHAVESTLDTHDHPGKKGEADEPWQTHTFAHIPLIADFVALTTLQTNVKNSETDVINYLLSEISADDFKVNKMEATVIANSNYIMKGGDYKAEVFIAAYDSTQDPEILVGNYRSVGKDKYEMVGNYETLPMTNGKGQYSAKTRSTGDKKWGGLIKVKRPNGGESFYPFDMEYAVAEPSVVVSPTKMNVFYYGIPNPVAISVPGVAADKIKATIPSGASIKKMARGGYEVTPKKTSGTVSIKVSAEIDGKMKPMQSKEFRIKKIPSPVAMVMGKNSGSTMSRAIITNANGVSAVLEDFVFDLKYRVTKFKVTATVGGFSKEYTAKGNQFTKQQKDLIKNMKSGSTLIIENIFVIGPDKREVPLSPIVFKIK